MERGDLITFVTLAASEGLDLNSRKIQAGETPSGPEDEKHQAVIQRYYILAERFIRHFTEQEILLFKSFLEINPLIPNLLTISYLHLTRIFKCIILTNDAESGIGNIVFKLGRTIAILRTSLPCMIERDLAELDLAIPLGESPRSYYAGPGLIDLALDPMFDGRENIVATLQNSLALQRFRDEVVSLINDPLNSETHSLIPLLFLMCGLDSSALYDDDAMFRWLKGLFMRDVSLTPHEQHCILRDIYHMVYHPFDQYHLKISGGEWGSALDPFSDIQTWIVVYFSLRIEHLLRLYLNLPETADEDYDNVIMEREKLPTVEEIGVSEAFRENLENIRNSIRTTETAVAPLDWDSLVSDIWEELVEGVRRVVMIVHEEGYDSDKVTENSGLAYLEVYKNLLSRAKKFKVAKGGTVSCGNVRDPLQEDSLHTDIHRGMSSEINWNKLR